MRTWLVMAVLTAGGVAHAQGDPLEAAATQQVAAQAPGSTLVAPFFKGSAKKTDWNILLEANKCYWFSGASGGSVKKLALYLWGPGAGAFTPRLTDAKSTSGMATMAWCAKEAGMHKFQAKIEGAGFYAVGVFAKDAPKQADPPPVAVKSGPNLGPICDKQASAASAGAVRKGDFFDGEGGSIGHKDRADYTVQMEAGKCYTIVGCGEPDHIKALSLFLWGPDGKRITEAKPDSPNAMVGTCPPMTGMYKVQAKVSGGSGAFKVGVYSK